MISTFKTHFINCFFFLDNFIKASENDLISNGLISLPNFFELTISIKPPILNATIGTEHDIASDAT